MGQGYFYVGYDVLRDLLYLPDEAEIKSVCVGAGPDQCAVYVEHPNLEDGVEYTPWFKEQPPIVFGGWVKHPVEIKSEDVIRLWEHFSNGPDSPEAAV